MISKKRNFFCFAGRNLLSQLWFAAVLVAIATSGGEAFGDEPASQQNPQWEPAQVTQLSGVKVSLSKPVLVARSKGFLWFPSLARLANGDLMAIMSNYADEITDHSTASYAWSGDGGLTWTPKSDAIYGDPHLRLANGDELILPYYLRPAAAGAMVGPAMICRKGERKIEVKQEAVTVSDWPRPDQPAPKFGLTGFVFNGQAVVLKDGRHLATLYGNFKDCKRYSLVAAESSDGFKWKIRSIIADHDCALPGKEGPCEAALCRLADGRLMTVFRLDSGVPYGQSYSTDEGRTWSKPVAMKNVFSVQPSLAVMDNGMVALSGGRSGVFLWINADGSGKDWQQVDIRANHNAAVPDERIEGGGNSSSYTEIVAVDASHLVYIYDRVPHSWNAIPADSQQNNSVWVVQATVERTAK